MPISEVVVADSSPLIHLHRIGQLDLLRRLFGRLEIPQTIRDEVEEGRNLGLSVPDLQTLEWMVVRPDRMDPTVAAEPGLHRGEIAALSLARSIAEHLLIVDDLAGREAAARLRLRFIGTAGVVVKARTAGLITSAAAILDQLAGTGFRLASDIRQRLLSVAGES